MRAAAQRKFLDLGGSAENQGDLRSVVLHKMSLASQKSTFPIALGVRITGVDDKAYSQTGESYSMITMPNADSHVARTLQEDNTDLAYEFVRSFDSNHAHQHTLNPHSLFCRRVSSPATPRRVMRAIESCTHATHPPPTRSRAHPSLCTDLDTKGIHEVAARRFCLVAAGALLPNQTHDPRQSLPPHPNLHRPPARVGYQRER